MLPRIRLLVSVFVTWHSASFRQQNAGTFGKTVRSGLTPWKLSSLEVPPSTLMRLQPGVPMAFRNVALQEATRGKLTFDLRFDALKS